MTRTASVAAIESQSMLGNQNPTSKQSFYRQKGQASAAPVGSVYRNNATAVVDGDRQQEVPRETALGIPADHKQFPEVEPHVSSPGFEALAADD